MKTGVFFICLQWVRILCGMQNTECGIRPRILCGITGAECLAICWQLGAILNVATCLFSKYYNVSHAAKYTEFSKLFSASVIPHIIRGRNSTFCIRIPHHILNHLVTIIDRNLHFSQALKQAM